MKKAHLTYILPLLAIAAVPAGAKESPLEDEIVADSVVVGTPTGVIEVGEATAEMVEADYNSDLNAAVLGAMADRGIDVSGLRVDTQVRSLDLRYSPLVEFDPDHSALRAETKIEDAEGRVIDTIPVALRAHPAPVPAENVEVEKPSMEAYYSALVDTYGDKVAEKIATRD